MTAIAAAASFFRPPTEGTAPPLTGLPLYIAAILIGLGNFLVVLDTTIANVSVPTIAGSLGVSSTQGTWVITSYAVAEAITVPLTGWLSRKFGAQRTFITCYLGFAAISLLCGMSGSLGMLLGTRVLLGLVGGPIMPLSQMIPPRIGPATGPISVVIAQMTVASVAFSFGNMRRSSICESGMIGPPNRPSRTRVPSSIPSVLDMPHNSETTPNAR